MFLFGYALIGATGAAVGATMSALTDRPLMWGAAVGGVSSLVSMGGIVLLESALAGDGSAAGLGETDPARFGPSPKQAARIARASGCKIVKSHKLHDGSWAHRVECRSHAAKVRFLANLAEFDSMTPDVRRAAEQIAAGATSAEQQIDALHEYVQGRVVFTREPTETFSPTMHTIAVGAGDCDDSARALVALLRALGHDAGMGTLPDVQTGAVPRHVAAKVRTPAGWQWLETTLPGAHRGEHPLEAAKRLGVRARGDLGTS